MRRNEALTSIRTPRKFGEPVARMWWVGGVRSRLTGRFPRRNDDDGWRPRATGKSRRTSSHAAEWCDSRLARDIESRRLGRLHRERYALEEIDPRGSFV